MADVNDTQDVNLADFNEPAQKPADSTNPAPAPADPAPADQQPAPTNPAPAPAEPAQPANPAPTDPYSDLMKDIQVPQGITMEESTLGGLKELGKKHNLSADVLKDLIKMDLNNSAIAAAADKRVIDDARKQWDAENAKKYGDDLKNVETNCSRVLAELDKDGKFKELLAFVGAEKHPATLGFLKSIGDVLLEKSSVNPNAAADPEQEVDLENFN